MLQPTTEKKTIVEKVIYSTTVYSFTVNDPWGDFDHRADCRIELRAGSQKELHDFIMASNGLDADPIKREVVSSFEVPGDEDGLFREVESVFRSGDGWSKINAIKRYRELTGVGLKEAKDAVDEWIASGRLF